MFLVAPSGDKGASRPLFLTHGTSERSSFGFSKQFRKGNSAKFACRGYSELAPSWENGPVVNRAAYVAVFLRVSPRYHG